MKIAVYIFSVLVLVSCTSIEDRNRSSEEFDYFGYMGLCGDTNPDWKYIQIVPTEISALEDLANTDLAKKGFSLSYAVQSWFANSRSDLMLCRTDQSPSDSCSGNWWSFANINGSWKITKTGGWVCVS